MKILYHSPHPIRIEDQTGYGTHMREMIALLLKVSDTKFIFSSRDSKP